MIRDYENKIEKEVMIVTSDYEKKQVSLLEDINRAQSEIKLKEMELEECKKKCILLENDIKNIKLSSTDGNVLKLLELERKMETTFQSLVCLINNTFFVLYISFFLILGIYNILNNLLYCIGHFCNYIHVIWLNMLFYILSHLIYLLYIYHTGYTYRLKLVFELNIERKTAVKQE